MDGNTTTVEEANNGPNNVYCSDVRHPFHSARLPRPLRTAFDLVDDRWSGRLSHDFPLPPPPSTHYQFMHCATAVSSTTYVSTPQQGQWRVEGSPSSMSHPFHSSRRVKLEWESFIIHGHDAGHRSPGIGVQCIATRNSTLDSINTFLLVRAGPKIRSHRHPTRLFDLSPRPESAFTPISPLSLPSTF